MTFATDILKPSSERNLYIRAETARNITSLLVDEGGGTYSYTYPHPLAFELTRNGSDLTEVSSIPSSNDEFYIDITNKKVTVKLASAPDTSTNILILECYLFYTSGLGRHIGKSISSGDEVYWEPRVVSVGSFAQNIKNYMVGITTSSFSTFSLNDADRDFKNFITENDTFSNKQVRVWIYFEDTGTSNRIGTANIRSIKIANNRVSFSMLDPLSRLNQPAYMGDSVLHAYARRETGSFPNMYPSDHGKPIPYVMSAVSPYNYFDTSPSGAYREYVQVPKLRAICTNYDERLETGSGNYDLNRSWVACRLPSTVSPTTQVIPTETASTSPSTGIMFYMSPGHNLIPGEDVTWNDGSLRRGKVWNADTFNYSGTNYNLYIREKAGTITPPANTSGIDKNTSPPVVMWFNSSTGGWVHMFHGANFNYSLSNTDGNNGFLNISLETSTNSPEYDFYGAGADPINPEVDEIAVTVKSKANYTHGDFVFDMLVNMGITIDTASITQADSDLVADLAYHIPNIDESEYRNNIDYLQEVLASTLGHLSVNDDGNVEYHIIAPPSSTDDISKADYLENSLSIKIDYNDIKNEVIATNPHISTIVDSNSIALDDSITDENLASKYLTNETNSFNIKHALEDITLRLDKILAVRANPSVTYSFETATRDLNNVTGSDIQLTSDDLPDSDTKDLKITKISKTLDRVRITADEIKGS